MLRSAVVVLTAPNHPFHHQVAKVASKEIAALRETIEASERAVKKTKKMHAEVVQEHQVT